MKQHLDALQQVYPPGEARALLRLVMEMRFGLSHTDLLLGKDKELSAEHQAELEIIIERLLRKEPVQYVLGVSEFCGHVFHVEPGVLIPRPETEEMVRSLISLTHKPGDRLLDIGTGSGCIAVSLALAGYRVTAFDISPLALCIAQANAERLGAKVDFVYEDILHPMHRCGQFDIIVSNPPYVLMSEAEGMEENVLRYEPHLALFVPDDNPLLFYHAIADYAGKHLKPGGMLALECNRAYAIRVAELLCNLGYTEAAARKDQFGNERFVIARAPVL
ncbi:MAG: peptide chain release factor N(5)-glutamine methyltransferase [Bacteroidaceae bacterium]|nr:peptide chain release factor N(5)-glutamine methyltransferase [Bacteroidaceae bacterium]